MIPDYALSLPHYSCAWTDGFEKTSNVFKRNRVVSNDVIIDVGPMEKSIAFRLPRLFLQATPGVLLPRPPIYYYIII